MRFVRRGTVEKWRRRSQDEPGAEMAALLPVSDDPDADSTLSWTVEPSDDGLLVTLIGELDIETAPQLRELLEDLVLRPKPPHVVLDLSGLSFFDSTGIAGFIRAARLSGGSLRLRNPTAEARRVLQVMQLEYLVE